MNTNTTLTFPSTPTIKVVYTKTDAKGTAYGHIIPNPRSTSEVYRVMLFSHHIPTKNILRVEPIQPLASRRH